MKTAVFHKKNIACAIALVVLASVFCVAFLPAGVANATSWGGTDTSSLWYYKSDFLDVDGAKAIVNGWNLSGVTSPITIAVIDTGIDVSHELFNGVISTNKDGNILGYNAYTGVGDDGRVDISDQSDKHGSEVAGVIAMLIHEFGLEDYIKIYPIKANTDKDKSFTLANLTKAINWAVDNAHADVINMSLGMLQKTYDSNTITARTAFEFAIEKASSSAVLVAAAGNKQDGDTTRNNAFYPASLSGVVSVGNQGKDGKLYSTSYYHSTTDICAPGTDIYTSNGYGSASKYKSDATGTSLSSAIVSFASALLKLRSVSEGRADSAPTLAKMLCAFSYPNTVSQDKLSYSALNLKTIVDNATSLGDINLNYQSPTTMSLVQNGEYGEEDYSNIVYMRADSITPIDFYVRISPIGEVDPEIENSIEWSVDRIKGVNDHSVVETISLGKGKSARFVPSGGGDYVVRAKLPYYGFETYEQVHVEYGKYYVGEVRVTYADNALDGVDNAPSSGKSYAKNEVEFALTGVEYLNPYTKTEWYVNGELVGEGSTFTFKPSKAGTYYITARYGDNSMVDLEYKFTLEVKSFILRPLDLSMLIIGCAIAIAVITVVTVVLVRKKKTIKHEKTNIEE